MGESFVHPTRKANELLGGGRGHLPSVGDRVILMSSVHIRSSGHKICYMFSLQVLTHTHCVVLRRACGAYSMLTDKRLMVRKHNQFILRCVFVFVFVHVQIFGIIVLPIHCC